MILKNRQFERKLPSKDARVFIIFCEGRKREPQYFAYFNEIDSRIRFEIIPPQAGSDESPIGLYQNAAKMLLTTPENPNPEYPINEEDEVWFVIDTDTWGEKITTLRDECIAHPNWSVAQSNPCFEVWLYYHIQSDFPDFEGMEISKKWKSYLNDEVVPGGFKSQKHSILIKTAIKNAQANYIEKDNEPTIGTTQVFQLAERFYPYIKDDIEAELAKLT